MEKLPGENPNWTPEAEVIPLKFTLQPGLNHCSNADYHADRRYISSSGLKEVYKDLEAYHRHYVLGVPKLGPGNQNALDEGSLTHTLILEPDQIDKEYAFFKGGLKRGSEWEAFKANAPAGKTLISYPQKVRCEAYAKSCLSNPHARELLQGGEPELTLCGELSGISVKTRFDYINYDKGYIADVKTTSHESGADFFKLACEQYMYFLSSALYMAVASEFYKKPFEFYFIVISKSSQRTDVYKLSQKSFTEGNLQLKEACAILNQARKTNVWTKQHAGSTIEQDSQTNEIQEV